MFPIDSLTQEAGQTSGVFECVCACVRVCVRHADAVSALQKLSAPLTAGLFAAAHKVFLKQNQNNNLEGTAKADLSFLVVIFFLPIVCIKMPACKNTS